MEMQVTDPSVQSTVSMHQQGPEPNTRELDLVLKKLRARASVLPQAVSSWTGKQASRSYHLCTAVTMVPPVRAIGRQ